MTNSQIFKTTEAMCSCRYLGRFIWRYWINCARCTL